MTTYSHTLTINDSQRIALEAALKLMIRHCESKLAERAGAPYWAHKKSCEEMLGILRNAEPQMTSWNTFGRTPEGDE